MELIKIKQDTSPESPREWDNFGTIVYKHRNYVLGDEKMEDVIDWLINKLDIEYSLYTNKYWQKLNNEPDMLQYLLGKFEKDYIYLPVYLYEHSGCTINTTGFSCRWDSGQVGFIYVSKERVRRVYGVTRISKKLSEKIKKGLNNEIEVFDQYIRGDVYGYVIEDTETGNELDSCWGFYGTDFMNNGMADYVPEHLHNQLKEFDLTKIEY